MKLKLGFLYVLPLFALQIAASGCNRANPQAAGPQMSPPPLVSVANAQAQDAAGAHDGPHATAGRRAEVGDPDEG